MISWTSIFVCILILVGAGIMSLNLFRFRNTIALLNQSGLQKPPLISRLTFVHQVLMIFFIVGYLCVVFAVLTDVAFISAIFVSIIFFFGAIFVWLGIRLQHQMISMIQSRFEQEAQARTTLAEEHLNLEKAHEQLNHEIEERHRTEKALRESEQRFKFIIDQLPAGVMIIDLESKTIKDANSAALDMIGMGLNDVIGKTCQNFICRAESGHCPIIDLHQDIDKSKRVLLTSKGSEIPILKTVCRIKLDGRTHLLEIFIDISEKEQLEAQLKQAQKMESLGTLAGGIAHDFNNILSAIMGYAELSKTNISDEAKVTDYLIRVIKAGGRARELVQQILSFSRQTEQELKPISLEAIVHEAVKLIRASLPSTIEINENINSQSLILADQTQIHQIIMNLCTNAGHAMMEKGGMLALDLADVEIDENSTPLPAELSPGQYIKLTISDTGHGMLPEILERIFEPFYTTKDVGKGTGMGLAVVHGLVKSHGGAIIARSQHRKGSTFIVYFPRIDSGPESETVTKEAIPMGSERVLLVDDEPDLVTIGEQMLVTLGYKVTTRTSSVEAIELFKAKPDQFDLVITDMTMPHITGEELAKELIAIRKDIAIIICTGFSSNLIEGNLKKMGVGGIMMKPIILSDLAYMVRGVLDNTTI